MKDNPEERPVHKARDVRGGEIVLRTRRRRILFIGGLIGIVLVAIIVRLAMLG